MMLSIIVPIFNEEQTLTKALERLLTTAWPGVEKEIILVDDGSTDGTAGVLRNFAMQPGIRVIRQNHLGKGAALIAGLAAAAGSAAIVQDADLEYDPADIGKLLAAYGPEIPAVFGSRNLNRTRQGYWRYVFGQAIITWFTNLLFGSRLTDVYTCYKLVNAVLLKSLKLQSPGFEIEAEMTAKLLKRKVKIAEIPISYQPRTFGQGKKIRAQDGLKALETVWKVFSSRNSGICGEARSSR